ncbi:DUF3150 domain-containing protein [Vibrio sp. 1180_3]|uniref:DUF3150 domain-containing protein n=1 Tax=Vibrio sp. 1180_3 TaxID=2528832 RepID=UPI00240744B7|nr:DUF3150 domain-containing protein [Vibrio sp. 1180_3]MDF9399163.1 DUF3150 domain-containing protein [Vibrio sp. 1180_3]
MSNTNNLEMSSVSDALKSQGLALIKVDISGSDFKKSLKYSEIGLEKDLEAELATLGRKSVFEKTYPKLLRNNKDQIYTYLDKMGVRFGSFGTWAVPTEIYQEVHKHLKEKQEEREAIKAELLRKYDSLLQEFARQAEELREGFGQIVLTNAYDKSHIQMQIGMVIEAQEDIISGISLSAIDGMSRLARDYDRDLMKVAKNNNTRPRITRFTRLKLEEMRDYCVRFMFLTSVLEDAARLIEQTIAQLPSSVASNKAYDKETSIVLTTLKLLTTPDELTGVVIDSPLQDETSSLDDSEETDSSLPMNNDEQLLSEVGTKIIVEEYEGTDSVLSTVPSFLGIDSGFFVDEEFIDDSLSNSVDLNIDEYFAED